MNIKLTPITSDSEQMQKYLTNEFCREVYKVYEQFYPKIGFHMPWVGLLGIARG